MRLLIEDSFYVIFFASSYPIEINPIMDVTDARMLVRH
jgi:hypothetical protein